MPTTEHLRDFSLWDEITSPLYPSVNSIGWSIRRATNSLTRVGRTTCRSTSRRGPTVMADTSFSELMILYQGFRSLSTEGFHKHLNRTF
jgi:hypothetical protein